MFLESIKLPLEFTIILVMIRQLRQCGSFYVAKLIINCLLFILITLTPNIANPFFFVYYNNVVIIVSTILNCLDQSNRRSRFIIGDNSSVLEVKEIT